MLSPSTPRASKWTFSNELPHKNLYQFHVYPILVTCPVHRSLLNFGIQTSVDKITHVIILYQYCTGIDFSYLIFETHNLKSYYNPTIRTHTHTHTIYIYIYDLSPKGCAVILDTVFSLHFANCPFSRFQVIGCFCTDRYSLFFLNFQHKWRKWNRTCIQRDSGSISSVIKLINVFL
jgi:hypothetical protein